MTAALERGEWLAARPDSIFPPGERRGTHFTGHLSQCITIKLSSTCFEQTGSSSGGYICTRSIQNYCMLRVQK